MSNLKRHLTDYSSIYLIQALFTGCFYGVRAIFVLYAISRFSLSESQAISLFATFMTLCYGTSIIGGYIADKALGVKKTIIVGSGYSSLGLLCVLSPLQDLCFLGLALTSLGSGLVKPNLLTAAGLIFEDPKDPRKDKVYSLLYIAMNLGNLVFPILCGFIGKTYGWQYGIGLISGALIGALYFVYKSMHFHASYKENLTLSQVKFWGTNLILITLLYLLFKYQGYFHSLMGIIMCGSIIYLGKIFYQCNPHERKDVLIIITYIFLFAIFCTLYEQAGSSLMLFYEKAVDRYVMGALIPSSVFLSLDPLFVLICGPALLFLSGKYLEKTNPIEGYIKVGWGFLWVALSFGILAISTFQNKSSSIPLLWVIASFFIQTIGELWIAPISFSKISQHAPPRYRSVLMSFWQMAIAYGHYLAGFVAQFSLIDTMPSLSPASSFEQYRTFFIRLAVLPLFVGLLLFLCQYVKWDIKKKIGIPFKNFFPLKNKI